MRSCDGGFEYACRDFLRRRAKPCGELRPGRKSMWGSSDPLLARGAEARAGLGTDDSPREGTDSNDIRHRPASPTWNTKLSFGEGRLPLCLTSRFGYTALSLCRLGDGISGGPCFRIFLRTRREDRRPSLDVCPLILSTALRRIEALSRRCASWRASGF